MSTNKYYRVSQDTPIWSKGAILKKDGKNYEAISDIWDAVEKHDEVLTEVIVEKNPAWFERVYEVNLLTKTVYKTIDQAKEFFNKEYSD